MPRDGASIELPRTFPWMEDVARRWLDENPLGYGRGEASAFCARFLELAEPHLKFISATIWSVNPVTHELVRIAAQGVEACTFEQLVLAFGECLCGDAVERQNITAVENVDATRDDGRCFNGPDELRRKRLAMLSVPVFNSANPHQVLIVVNFIWRALPGNEDERKSAFENMASHLALLFEAGLWDYGVRASNRLQLEIGGIPHHDRKEKLRFLVRFMRRWVKCDGVALYVQAPDRTALELRVSEGHVFSFEETKEEPAHVAERAWLENREFFANEENIGYKPGVPPEHRFRQFRRQLNADTVSFIFIPIHDLMGEARGVIRCYRRFPAPHLRRIFTYEDAALIEILARGFMPHLDVLLANEALDHEIHLVAHELRNPVAAFRAAIERVSNESEQHLYRFKHNYFQEIDIYLDSMRRIMVNLDLARKGPLNIHLEKHPTSFVRDILAPAKRFLRPVLARRKLRFEQIEWKGFDGFPELFVDPTLMTQVVFNLMENAVKYHHGESADFFLRIIANKTPDERWQITFEDYGGGLPEKMRERIFERGCRAHDDRSEIPGDGLGLWYARQIVERHSGTLVCERHHDPTRFVLALPSKKQSFDSIKR